MVRVGGIFLRVPLEVHEYLFIERAEESRPVPGMGLLIRKLNPVGWLSRFASNPDRLKKFDLGTSQEITIPRHGSAIARGCL
jgi:hypothetical protein